MPPPPPLTLSTDHYTCPMEKPVESQVEFQASIEKAIILPPNVLLNVLQRIPPLLVVAVEELQLVLTAAAAAVA
jgi:hypothetical protein